MQKIILVLIFTLGFVAAGVAQEWELGVLGGYGVSTKLTATSAVGEEADTGFEGGLALGAFIGQNITDYLGGEIRYVYRSSEMLVEGGGEKAAFTGHSHLFHYDVMVHTEPTGSDMRPFIAFESARGFSRAKAPNRRSSR